MEPDIRRQARWTALFLGTALFVTLLSMVYAVIQRTEAREQRMLAEKMAELSVQNQREAKQQLLHAEQALAQCEKRCGAIEVRK